jgi:hypothetical protein
MTPNLSYANAAAVEAALDKAESALQPGDIGETVQGYDAYTSKTDVAENFTGKKTLSGGYEESGSTLVQSGASLTIPVDGKTYQLTPSQAITSITTTLPTAPACSGCTIYITQGATGHAISYPAAWRWPNGMATPVSTAANSVTRLTLSTSPAGHVHADADVRSVV